MGSFDLVCYLARIKGDEIMVINGALVGDLDLMYIESLLQEELSVVADPQLSSRSARRDLLLRTTADFIDSLVCPPPHSDQFINVLCSSTVEWYNHLVTSCFHFSANPEGQGCSFGFSLVDGRCLDSCPFGCFTCFSPLDYSVRGFLGQQILTQCRRAI